MRDVLGLMYQTEKSSPNVMVLSWISNISYTEQGELQIYYNLRRKKVKILRGVKKENKQKQSHPDLIGLSNSSDAGFYITPIQHTSHKTRHLPSIPPATRMSKSVSAYRR